jgi:hypothetical protein
MKTVQYKERVKINYVKLVGKMIEGNSDLTKSQKQVLNEYRDDLETKLPINFTDESCKLVN